MLEANHAIFYCFQKGKDTMLYDAEDVRTSRPTGGTL